MFSKILSEGGDLWGNGDKKLLCFQKSKGPDILNRWKSYILCFFFFIVGTDDNMSRRRQGEHRTLGLENNVYSQKIEYWEPEPEEP